MDRLRSSHLLHDEIDETSPDESLGQRVVAYAPTPQDARLCNDILGQNGIKVCCCDTISAFCQLISQGAGMALIAQEYLDEVAVARLQQTLARQPKWSELPILVLLQAGEIGSVTLNRVLTIQHVTLINRPLRIAVFINTIQAKLRDRKRQYELRDLLIEKDRHQIMLGREATRLDMALKAAGMAAWEWTPTGVYSSTSMAKLLGYDEDAHPSELELFDRIVEEDRPEVVARWSEAVDKNETFRSEFRIEHPKLGERWMAAVGEPVRSKSGETLCYAGLQWDITPMKTQAIALKKADEAKTRVSGKHVPRDSHANDGDLGLCESADRLGRKR